jgi:beta-glucuronidase
MIERDWNHPSVVAWSVGNEYASDTPSGVRWTSDMVAFVRGLDPSRPVTFASFRAFRPDLARPEDEGSTEVDFVSINTYAQPDKVGEVLDLVHRRWPDRPIFVSEFGWRADKAKDEALRQHYFESMAAAFRTRPWIAGASIWTYNDYISRYPDTAPNGYRPWGLVDPDRALRASYETVRQQFAVARLEAAALDGSGGGGPRLRATIVSRADFPSRRVEGLRVRVGPATSDARVDARRSPMASQDVPDLQPGARVDVGLTLPPGLTTAPLIVELVRADGTVLPGALTIDAWSRAR